MTNTHVPVIEEVVDYLSKYGWKYRETTGDGKKVLLAPYGMEKGRAILISFRVEGEFVLVSTVGLLKVGQDISRRILLLNDMIKLVKLFIVHESDGKIEVDMGFELWAGSWNESTFFSFMDMLQLGIEDVMRVVKQEHIVHETRWIELSG